MLFLILAMLFSAVLALVLKYLDSGSPYGVFFVNYITCALLAFGALQPRTLYNGDLTPCWLGGITGLIYLASLSANGYSIHKNGAILSSVFTRLGVLVPILVSVTLFGERPTLLQGLGAALGELPAFLVYPSYSVGVILVISAASFFHFRERLNRRQMGAAGMILGALVLLNL